MSPRQRSNFYVGMAAAVALIVIAGFSPRFSARLLQPPTRPPAILYVHVATFTGWVLLFLLQTTLTRLRRVGWHRTLGAGGIVLGSAMPVIGILTAIAMTRFHGREADPGSQAFLAVSCFDMLAFGAAFGFAIYWRRRPEYHRRLMLMATCGLTVAAFARLPHALVPANTWYVAVDLLLLVAIARDRYLDGRVHPVYRLGVPALLAGQALTMWIYLERFPSWLSVARLLLVPAQHRA